MRSVTNLQLLYAATTCLVLLGLVVALYTLDGNAQYHVPVIVIGGLIAVVTPVLALRVLGRDSAFWERPVSARVARFLINGVVAVWLCIVGLMALILLTERRSLQIGIAVALLALFGAGLGRYLQRRFASASLMPYGVSFFCSLVLGILLVAVIGA